MVAARGNSVFTWVSPFPMCVCAYSPSQEHLVPPIVTSYETDFLYALQKQKRRNRNEANQLDPSFLEPDAPSSVYWVILSST